MSFFGGGKANNSAVEKAFEAQVNQMQLQDSMKTYNNLVERCFNICAVNFTMRQVDSDEELCMGRCVDKYLKHVGKVGRIFAEQSMLQNQAQGDSGAPMVPPGMNVPGQ